MESEQSQPCMNHHDLNQIQTLCTLRLRNYYPYLLYITDSLHHYYCCFVIEKRIFDSNL